MSGMKDSLSNITPNIARRSLVFRLSALFFVLAFLLAGSQYLLFRYLWVHANDDAVQRVHWDLAKELSSELQPLLKSKSQIEELYEAIARFERLHPAKRIFILDKNGDPKEYTESFNPHGDARKFRSRDLESRVSVELLEDMLTPTINRKLPIYGPAIFRASEVSPFSVSRISRFGEPGYLYVILNNNPKQVVIQGIETYYLTGAGLFTSVLLFSLVSVIGAFLTRNLVKRFRKFTQGVAAIADGDLEIRVPVSGNDEITDLGAQINSMADEIASNVDRLKKNDVWRREMTAAISHDLKGPIASLGAHLEQMPKLLEQGQKDELAERFSILEKATSTLKGYVTDILDLAQLEAGEVTPSIISFYIQELLSEEIFPMFKSVAEKAKVELELSCDEKSPVIFGDPDLLARVLMNLVSNALQYTQPGGKVILGCKAQEKGVSVYVEDSGPGMSDEQLLELQKPFARGDRARSSSTPGAGLGLAIAKSIVECHGQKLEFASTPGVGSRFGFQIGYDRPPKTSLNSLTQSSIS